tara:strand:+ start:1155 stop:1292 length:138 start_codon:yes stop_codon:yes gene_type:complete
MNKTQRMSIETPIGKIESDSGNHFLDIISLCLVIGFFFLIKKYVK